MPHATVCKTEGSSHEQIKNQDNCRNFFSISGGVVHKECVPPGVTVNQKYYLEVLDRLRNRVTMVQIKIADVWILRASSRQRAGTHNIVSSWISSEKVHSSASAGSLFSRFVTLWFLLVPKIKIESQGPSFSNTWQRPEGCIRRHQYPDRSWLPICYEGRKIRSAKRIASEGCYFEGDNAGLDE
jgi:hypothetical protein